MSERVLNYADDWAGSLAVDVMKSQIWPDTAAALHAAVASALEAEGFRVWFEWPTRPLGDERNGRIDIVARYGKGWVAIELDARKPRARSLRKLRLFKGCRIVGLRGVHGHEIPDGIDFVAILPVRQATAAEISDKRTIKRYVA